MYGASLVAQRVKCLSALPETQVQFLDWEDFPGEGNGNPLQHPCLGNPMDRAAWQVTIHGVTRVRYDRTITFLSFPPPWDLGLLSNSNLYMCFSLSEALGEHVSHDSPHSVTDGMGPSLHSELYQSHRLPRVSVLS